MTGCSDWYEIGERCKHGIIKGNSPLCDVCHGQDEISELKKRVKELERYQEITHLEYLNRNKKPHKCPVCDGKKVYQSTQSTPPYVLHNSCTSCEGKGIVWS